VLQLCPVHVCKVQFQLRPAQLVHTINTKAGSGINSTSCSVR
jgi:hypothetical protein